MYLCFKCKLLANCKMGKASSPLLYFLLLAATVCRINVFGVCDSLENENTSSDSDECQKIKDDLISRNPRDIKFILYSSMKNLESPQTKSKQNKKSVMLEKLEPWNLTAFQKSAYNETLPLKVLVHGFMSNSTDVGAFSQMISSAYLDEETPVNIIVVDWGPLSTVKNRLPLMQYYTKAASNVKLVGSRVAELIIFLLQSALLPGPEKVHLIGFSLGAHVCGVAGRLVLQNVSQPVQRITGLDPAGPYFQKVTSDQKLDSADANFVDIYHTNQGKNGYRGNLGHVDFYPNGGGPDQPKCANVTETIRFLAGICAHSMAYKYFEKSIRVKNITACKCNHLIDSSCKHLHSYQIQETTIFGDGCPESA